MPPQTVKSELNYSPASERNKVPILEVLKHELVDITEVWEIGSGTGQHAVFLAEALPHLIWQTSDLKKNHPDIQARIINAQLPNLKPPVELDVNHFPWPLQSVQAVFSANTLHIISEVAVRAFSKGSGRVFKTMGSFVFMVLLNTREASPATAMNSSTVNSSNVILIAEFAILNGLINWLGQQIVFCRAIMKCRPTTVFWFGRKMV